MQKEKKTIIKELGDDKHEPIDFDDLEKKIYEL